MTKDEIKDEIQRCREKLQELEAKLKEPKLLWEPEEGDKCYRINWIGDYVHRSNVKRADVYEKFLLNGNLFRTHEIAYKVMKKRNARNRLECIALDLNDGWEPDWEDNQKKWFVYFDHNIGQVIFFGHRTHEEALTYFKSKATARLAWKLLEQEHKEALGWV